MIKDFWLSTVFLATCAGLAASLLPAVAKAEIKSELVDYKQGNTALQGFFAYDDAVKGKRPTVVLVHEWWGNNENTHNQALRLAKAGYAAFALDMYGKGKVTAHPDDAKKFVAEATADSAQEKARFDAAMTWVKARPEVEPKKVAAIGYCFGGAVVLDMVRLGEQFPLVATFHGALSSKLQAKAPVKTRLLILHGAADPMVTQAALAAFKKEMTAAKANFQVIEYPGAQHGFTNPDAAKAGVPGLAYDAKADAESFAALLKALKEQMGPPAAAK